MSTHLGEVGSLHIKAVCAPEEQSESYQIEGPCGMVWLTWDQWNEIKEKVENHHVLKHTPEGKAIG